MTMLPLAAIYAGRPQEAYRATYRLSFFDVGIAKDINAAVVAGLSVALQLEKPTDQQSRERAWQSIRDAMRQTDPYRYDKVPFAARPTTTWLDFSQSAVRDAQKKPKRLYEILEKKGQVKYYWESHFILAVVFSTIEFCDYDPLAALALILDFGHDTDSSAQLLAAFAGAIYGPELFPEKLQQPVIKQLKLDYDISVNEWTDLLHKLGDLDTHDNVVDLSSNSKG